jgi:phospholipid/cholesterol/gamma-HCH transport system ATP-binding protein
MSTFEPLESLPVREDAPPPDGEVLVEVKDLVREFNGRRVLDGISFQVRRGETMIVMGGSGCGKSTLLRHLNGALKPTSGSIKLFGEEITTMESAELDRMRRRFGMNYQFGALLQSLTVWENVALPLLENSQVHPDIVDLVVKMKLELVGMTGFEDFKPAQISGGMRKRVGLARAVALDPELLFSDEPTSGLDPAMTAVIDKLMVDLSRSMRLTSVVITHDMVSAFRIGTRMIMLGTGPMQGKIVAEGTPEEIRHNPDPMLQQFIRGEPDGPIPLKLSKGDYLNRLLQ